MADIIIVFSVGFLVGIAEGVFITVYLIKGK